MPFDLAADTAKLCRVCMTAKEGHRTDLYDATSFVSGQPSLHGMLKAVCAPVFNKSNEEDAGMPTKVCAVCRNATIAAFKLHQICIDTERKLGQLLALKRELQNELKDDDKISEERGDPLKNNKKVLETTLQEQPSIRQEEHDDEPKSQDVGKSHQEDSMPNSETEDTIKVEELDLVDEVENDENHASDSGEQQEPFDTSHKVKRICQICSETFYKPSLLRNHMTQKHQLYMCEICHETFGSLSWFVKHKATKHKRRPACNNCGEKFETKIDLKVHHQQGTCSGKIIICSICKETFPTRVALHKHRITHRTTYKCSICDKIAASKGQLDIHMKRHMGVKELACASCPMRFCTRIELESHTLTHTKTKNAICDICGSRFTKKESLKMHVKRVHEGCITGYRPYECSLCGLKFSMRCILRRHMLTHTGEKPHKCQLCPQAYAQTNDLVKHVARVHGLEKPYQCDRCHEAFRLLTDLRQHYRVHVQSTEGGAEQMEEVRFTSVAILQRAFAKDKVTTGD